MDDSREYPARPLCGVGAIVKKGDTVLLVRRGKPPLSGEWSVPGGAVEIGETLQEATRREIHEETGIEISVGPVADAIEIIQRDGQGRVKFHYVIVDFVATWLRGELTAATDASEARWVPIGDLDKYNIYPRTLEVIRKGIA